MTVRSVQSITYNPPNAVSQLQSTSDDPEGDFVKLLASEITNQDPDQPMDSTSMVTQYAQINSALGLQELVRSNKVYQKVQTAGSLINQQVSVTDPTTNQTVTGKVRGLDFSGSTPLVDVNGTRYPIDNVRTVGE